jgi:hypothetical protein
MGLWTSKVKYPLPFHDCGFCYDEAGLAVEIAILREDLIIHRHYRATPAEIDAVINGDRPSAEETEEIYASLCKNHPKKDKPIHWYLAQLIHYGLRQTQTKWKAQRSLRRALLRGSLVVNKRILILQHQLKSLYDLSEGDGNVRELLALQHWNVLPTRSHVSRMFSAIVNADNMKSVREVMVRATAHFWLALIKCHHCRNRA